MHAVIVPAAYVPITVATALLGALAVYPGLHYPQGFELHAYEAAVAVPGSLI